jgi:hypothetical protein
MTWLVWRQRRGEAIGVALVLAGLGLVALPAGMHLHQVAAAFTLDRCQTASPSAACAPVLGAFDAIARLLTGVVPWLSFLPGLLGVFIGAPLIAREIDEGTWRLAWSQSVTRWRWLRAQLTGAGLLVTAGAAGLTIIFMWWLNPWDNINGRFANDAFDTYGLIPAAWSVCVFGIGVLAGTLARRVVPAMAITLGTYLAVRMPIEFHFRSHYLAPVTLWGAPPSYSLPPGDLQLAFGTVAPHSHHILTAQQYEQVQYLAKSAAAQTHPAASSYDAQLAQFNHYLSIHGYTQSFTYQPASRFWAFQGIETAICLVLAALAIGIACHLLLRRPRAT